MRLLNTLMTSVFTLGMTACATSWQATNHYDEFTDSAICRVEKGTQGQKDFVRGFTGVYFTQNFYAENHDGEIRAGVRTYPPLPIGGDVQIKVGETLYTLTSKDTPIDMAPVMPKAEFPQDHFGQAYGEAMETITQSIQASSSPYRAYTGKKAMALLKDMASAQGEVKFRTVGVNKATSGTASFMIDDSFTEALAECDIKL
jgi:hypothetical protein